MILLNPGPVNVSDRVREAAAMHPICHREPEYFDIQDDVRNLLTELFDFSAKEIAPVLLAGSGTSAVEAMISSGVPRGKRLLVVDNGVYGDRMARMAEVYGIPHDRITFPWETPADPGAVEEIAARIPGLGAIAIVHHETTTGLINPISAHADLAKKLGVRILVDSVSGLGGEEIDVSALDFCAGTAGKSLQGLPGVSFVFAKRSLLEESPGRSLYLDLQGLCSKQDRRGTPFTPAVPIMNAFREALLELKEEGIRNRIHRYAEMAQFLREGFSRANLEVWLPAAVQSNSITTLHLPEGKSYTHLHGYLKERGFVIYAGQGNLETKAFRICNMGWLPREELDRLLKSIEEWTRI